MKVPNWNTAAWLAWSVWAVLLTVVSAGLWRFNHLASGAVAVFSAYCLAFPFRADP